MEQEAIVLLENRATLPLADVSKVAVIGPQSDRVSVCMLYFPIQLDLIGMIQFGDYVFFNASNNGISPLDGIKEFLANKSSNVEVSFAEIELGDGISSM